MKNRFVGLLAVALFSTFFAAGCGKLVKCEDAKVADDCKKEKFEENKFNCEWKTETKEGKEVGKCVEKAPTAEELTKANELCAKDDGKKCTERNANLKGYHCVESGDNCVAAKK